MQETISVVIPTFNYGSYIAEAILSAVEQTFPPSEIIVVDDGSSDDTESKVRAFGDAVTYIRQQNSGVGAARNRGVAESTGDLIAFLDADDTWEPTKLEKQIGKFAEDPEIGLVHCGLREFDTDSGETVAEYVTGLEGWVAEELVLFENPVICGPGSTTLVKRGIFLRAGGYDTTREMHPSEDWEVSVRLARVCKVGFVPEPLVHYRNHGVNAHLNVSRMEHSALCAWKRVFDTDDSEVLRLKRRSYGNLHKVLAGSYLHNGEWVGFARNIIKSLWYRPSYAWFYLTMPTRRKRA